MDTCCLFNDYYPYADRDPDQYEYADSHTIYHRYTFPCYSNAMN